MTRWHIYKMIFKDLICCLLFHVSQITQIIIPLSNEFNVCFNFRNWRWCYISLSCPFLPLFLLSFSSYPTPFSLPSFLPPSLPSYLVALLVLLIPKPLLRAEMLECLVLLPGLYFEFWLCFSIFLLSFSVYGTICWLTCDFFFF